MFLALRNSRRTLATQKMKMQQKSHATACVFAPACVEQIKPMKVQRTPVMAAALIIANWSSAPMATLDLRMASNG